MHYSGYVELTSRKKKHVVHNSGTRMLFKLFAQILSGSTIDSKALPAYIQLLNGKADPGLSGDPITTTGLLFNPILVSKQAELKKHIVKGVTSSQWTTVLTGTLIPENIINYPLSVNTDYHLVLLDGYRCPLAVIDVHPETIVNLSNGEQCLIQWNICFTNGEVLLDD